MLREPERENYMWEGEKCRGERLEMKRCSERQRERIICGREKNVEVRDSR